MDKNSFFYTFSTIAQVLAAFIALSGVFVLFKIQEVRKAQLTILEGIENALHNLFASYGESLSTFHQVVHPIIRLKTIRKTESLGAVKSALSQIFDQMHIHELRINSNITSDEYNQIVQRKAGNILLDIGRFNELAALKRKMVVLTIVSVCSGALTISFSIIALMFFHALQNYNPLFVLAGLGVFITIGSMAYLIILSLFERKISFIQGE